MFQTYLLPETKWVSENLGLQPTIELLLLLSRLEAAVPKLGRSIDELKLDLLEGHTRRLLQ